MKFRKLDKILIPFYRLHFKHSLIQTIKHTIFLFYKPEKYIAINTNPFKKFMYRIMAFTLGTILTILMIPLYILIYLLTAIFTFVPVTIIALGIGLYYGLLPFLLKLEKYYEPKEAKERPKRSGLDTLLIPLSWSGIITRAFLNNVYQTGLNPSRRINELKNKKETYIIMRLGLGIASVIAYLLYSLVFFALLELTSFFTLSLIALIALLIWSILVLFIRVIGKLFSDQEFSEKEEDDK